MYVGGIPMPEANANKQTTIGTSGVTVTKRLEQEEFSDPVVAFDIESKREAPAVVTVVDEIPEGVSASDLRFHPEYGSQHWVVDDDQLVFEREFEPQEEFITVYRLTEVSDEVASEEFTDPAVQTETAADDTDVAAGVEQVESGDAIEGEPEDDGVVEADEDAPTLDLNEPMVGDGSGEERPAEERTTTVMMNGDDSEVSAADGELTLEEEPEETDAEEAAEEPEETDDSEEAAEAEPAEDPEPADADEPETAEESEPADAADSPSLVAEMAAEIEDGNVPEEDVDRLRAALGAENRERKSMVVRVEKLQRDVDEVLAYTDALAEFLDENGTGEELITEFRDEVADFREEMGEFQADLSETQETAEENAERVDDLETDVDDRFEDVDDRFDDVHDELADLREEIDAVRAEIEEGEVEQRLSSLESDVDTLEDWRGRLASVMGEV